MKKLKLVVIFCTVLFVFSVPLFSQEEPTEIVEPRRKALKIQKEGNISSVGLGIDSIQTKLRTAVELSDSENALMFSFFYKANITLTSYQKSQVRYMSVEFNKKMDDLLGQYKINSGSETTRSNIVKEMQSLNIGFNLDLFSILTTSQCKMYNEYIIKNKFKK